MKKTTFRHFLILVFSLLANPSQAQEAAQKSWELLLGYGESHPGWGDTQERVETRDLILRQVRPQSFTRGEGWYRNRRSVLIELPVHFLKEPQEPPMFGITFNACWTFLAHPRYQPYVLVGGGPLYTQAEIPGTSSKLKGSYQAGAGLKIDLSSSAMLRLEYRFHHVSNGGIKKPNDPLNSDKLLLGLQLPF
ncbi:MAG: acyloxyacyl hydrolase [Candidatus Thiodiazotropha sp.]